MTTALPSPLDELRVLLVTLAAIAIPGWALLGLRGAARSFPPLQALGARTGARHRLPARAVHPGRRAGALGGARSPHAAGGSRWPAPCWSRWQQRRDLLAPLRFARLEQIALLVVLATLATRLWVAHEEPFPAWSDSLHHVLLTDLTATAGRLPTSMAPYFPIPLARYHLGLYALTGTVQSLAGVPAHVAVTWVAQVLSGLCGLGVYLVLDRHVGRVPAVIGAVVAGLISHQPAFYVNWGRFTQLAAQTILLPAWLVVWETLRGLGAPDGVA